jgi:hypothetical protein
MSGRTTSDVSLFPLFFALALRCQRLLSENGAGERDSNPSMLARQLGRLMPYRSANTRVSVLLMELSARVELASSYLPSKRPT